MQNLLSFGVAGTEGAVQLEVIYVVEEGAPHREEDILNQTNIRNKSNTEEDTKSRRLRNFLNKGLCGIYVLASPRRLPTGKPSWREKTLK
jgi:hypothetical protein